MTGVVNNIFNTQFNLVATASNVNLGDAVNIKPTFDRKLVGSSFPVGCGSVNLNASVNDYFDADGIDSPVIGTLL
ncbi:spore germination protein [Hazenella coriacea]|uniref:Spore germination protein GerPA/GerPF n=1 Tax=Hazenella coriacea TaxID=1179467 RepID=A0A4R3L740_9BACL|nr:spore germination protein [Hazenella coriacea]TCS94740.1 spore germination protein GerPA/GerPF [Hazenella coriacea]